MDGYLIALLGLVETQDGNDRLMMRIALAIMEELEDVLLEQDDFELLVSSLAFLSQEWIVEEKRQTLTLSAQVTQLKVTPARWGSAMLRKVGHQT